MPKIPKDPTSGLYITELDGVIYEFEKWGAELALNSLFDLAAIAAKPLANIGAAMVAGDAIRTELTESLAGLFANIGPNKDICMRLIKTLATSGVLAAGKPIASFNFYYSGKLTHLRKVVMAAGEVQLGDFLDELKTQQPAS